MVLLMQYKLYFEPIPGFSNFREVENGFSPGFFQEI